MSSPAVIAETSLASPASSISLSGLSLARYPLVAVVAEGIIPTGAWDRTMLRFNDDATRANYIWRVRNDDETAGDSTDVGTYIPGIEFAHFVGPDFGGTDYRGINTAEIWRPGSDEIYKSMIIHGEMPISTYALGTRGGGVWKSTAPITKITCLTNAGGNISAGATLKLLALCEATLGTYTPPTPADSFTRANSNTVGSPWVEYEGAAADISILSNQLRFNATYSPSLRAIWNGRPFSANHYSQFEMQATSLTGGHWVGPTVRNSIDGGNQYVVIWFNGSCQIYKMVAGTYTALGSNVATTFAIGDTFRLEASGTTITAKKNGATIVSVSDSAVAGPGLPGIAAYGTALCDNFAAGDL